MVHTFSGLLLFAGAVLPIRGGHASTLLREILAALVVAALLGYLYYILREPKVATDGRASNSLTGLFVVLATLVASVLLDALLRLPPNSAKYWVLFLTAASFGGLYLTSHKQDAFFKHLRALLLAWRGKASEESYNPIDEAARKELERKFDWESAIEYRKAMKGEED